VHWEADLRAGKGKITHTMLTLYSYCAHTVLTLYSYCTHTVPTLYSYCAHTVVILCSHCAQVRLRTSGYTLRGMWRSW
jgi:hypothetical protein